MITEVYFIEENYLYTWVGSSGRRVRTSYKGAIGVPKCVVPVPTQRTLRKGAIRVLWMVVAIGEDSLKKII